LCSTACICFICSAGIPAEPKSSWYQQNWWKFSRDRTVVSAWYQQDTTVVQPGLKV
jgi:hypothetical protein